MNSCLRWWNIITQSPWVIAISELAQPPICNMTSENSWHFRKISTPVNYVWAPYLICWCHIHRFAITFSCFILTRVKRNDQFTIEGQTTCKIDRRGQGSNRNCKQKWEKRIKNNPCVYLATKYLMKYGTCSFVLLLPYSVRRFFF